MEWLDQPITWRQYIYLIVAFFFLGIAWELLKTWAKGVFNWK